jgi:hypothetical protein
MSLDTLIADTRKAITDDAANAVPVSRTLVTSGYLASGG